MLGEMHLKITVHIYHTKRSITFICWSNKNALIRYNAAGKKLTEWAYFKIANYGQLKKKKNKGDFDYPGCSISQFSP